MLEKTTRRASNRHQILALSGGGYRGLFTASFLESCEEKFQTKCAQRFDLIAGTSIGALLAAGLALDIPATAMKSAMLKHGPLIFKQTLVTPLKRFALHSPYDSEPLKQAIFDVLTPQLAQTRLDAIDAPLLINAVNYTTGSSEIFRSRGCAGSDASEITLVDAVLASAAAPTYFPLKKIGVNQYADGGLIANAPDMVALGETLSTSKAFLENIYMLSIGTAGRREGAALRDKAFNPSVLSWFFVRGLVQSIMSAQEVLAVQQASDLLRLRHIRIDQEPAQQQVKAISSLDKADQQATDTLISLAQTAFDREKTNRQLRSFF